MSTPSPVTRRFLQKALDMGLGYKPTLKELAILRRAFVEALKEEVERRFPITLPDDPADPLAGVPLVIAGLGSFKMKTRTQRTRVNQLPGSDGIQTITLKAGRRLVFTSKWEPIK